MCVFPHCRSHPDKNKDPESLKMFLDIQKAFEILSENETKSEYDTLLTEGVLTSLLYCVESHCEVFHCTSSTMVATCIAGVPLNMTFGTLETNMVVIILILTC